LCAIAVALNIIYSGLHLVRRSVGGLMDTADPAVQKRILGVLDRECAARGITHQLLRQRFNGAAHDIDVHLVFPDAMPIVDAHRIATRVEQAIQAELHPSTHVTTHLEPRDDHKNTHPRATVTL